MVDRATPTHLGWEDSYTMRHLLTKLSAAGMEEPEIANLLGVRLGSLKAQLLRVPALEEALVAGKSQATQHMVAQLFKTAIGGQVYQEVVEKINSKGEKTTTIITKESPPNALLMMFWLTNRDGDNWRNIRQLLKETHKESSYGNFAEADKIARLSRDILECHPDGTVGEHSVPQETPRTAGAEPVGTGDLPGDMPSETASGVQNDVLDVSTEA